MTTIRSKVAGAFYGGAIGDGIGAPLEGLLRKDILTLAGPVQGFLPPTAQVDGVWIFCPDRKDGRGWGKGEGHFTDDTLMTEALIKAYIQQRGHMEAWDYRNIFAPILARHKVWVPERQCDMAPLERLAGAEQWHIRGLLSSNRDPRFFGAALHNLTCGASMCAWPIGAVNAGDPRGAYAEAVAFFSPQTFSFGLEQGAVMAAACAEACAPDATPQSIAAAALALAKDASREMIAAALAALTPGADRDRDLPAVHAAVQPWHHKRTHISDTAEVAQALPRAGDLSNSALESRLHTCEEVAVALAMLVRANGDFMETVCAAAEYGEDADSIAGMAGALAGALGGVEAIPQVHRDYCYRQNRRNLQATAETFAEAVQAIATTDQQRMARRARSVG